MAWRVLDGLIAVVMTLIALSLQLGVSVEGVVRVPAWLLSPLQLVPASSPRGRRGPPSPSYLPWRDRPSSVAVSAGSG